MTEPQVQRCADCNCGRAASNEVPSDETIYDARSFTAPAEVSLHDELPNQSVPLRSKQWFNPPDDPMGARYFERYLNWGLTMAEVTTTTTPIIGIAQTGSDLAPCNRHHLQLVSRIRDGIIAAGGTPFEFPCHPIQETSKRPAPSLDRNLTYMALVEILFGYPLDGVVLLTGCDKTTPALLMAAATVNIPAIAMNVGPMLNGYAGERLIGSGGVTWENRTLLSQGKITREQFNRRVALAPPSVGHCNTMGTASTMNALAEALGMALPGSASIPAAYRERGACAWHTGHRIVRMVQEDLKPSDILIKEAFENAIACCTAIGGSTNAPIHLNAIAKHAGVELDCQDWERIGYELPVLVNVKPSGQYLCEEYHRAGGLPAVIAELLENNKIPHPKALTVTGQSVAENCQNDQSLNLKVVRRFNDPVTERAGFLNLKGNLFDSAIMKTSGISKYFRERFLSDPQDPMAFEGNVAVFDGPEDYNATINTRPGINENTILVMRGAGPVGHPGAAEVVNMIPPVRLIERGVELPCLGDGRQSGTSGTPAILNASPEAATGGLLGYLKDGDRIRIDLNKRTANVQLSPDEIAERRKSMGAYKYPESQTPWQEIFRAYTSELSEGMVLKNAVKYQRLAQVHGVPRTNHA